jgi:hypothetical protein
MATVKQISLDMQKEVGLKGRVAIRYGTCFVPMGLHGRSGREFKEAGRMWRRQPLL